MKILFATANPHLPETTGGMENSSNELIKRLQGRGHEVSLICGLRGKGLPGFWYRFQLKAGGKGYVKDRPNGYDVYRSWFAFDHLPQLIQEINPDIVVVMAGLTVKMALAVKTCNVPVLMMLQDVTFDQHGGDFAELGQVPCVANSSFTAKTYASLFHVKPGIINPIINKSAYQVERDPAYVTFINPFEVKGVNLALEVAAKCPDIPFLFVESWALTSADKKALLEKLGALSNVRFLPFQKNMRDVYLQTKLLLVPSQCDEAFGRVVAEGQVSGIPVIASKRGGLPESVGLGGILVAPEEGADKWAEQVRALWTDREKYKDLSQKALAYSKRDALDPDKQTQNWEQAISEAVKATS